MVTELKSTHPSPDVHSAGVFSTRNFEGVHLEKVVVQELLAGPTSCGILVQATFHEVDAFVANNVFGHLSVNGVDCARIRDAEAAEELVGLEDLHVSGNEVAKISPDQIELIHI